MVAAYTAIASARSLWLAFPVGLLAFLLLAFLLLAYGRQRLLTRRRLRVGIKLAAVLVVCPAVVALWWWAPRRDILVGEPTSGYWAPDGWTLVGPEVPWRGTFRLTADVHYDGFGTVNLEVQRPSAKEGEGLTTHRVLLPPGRGEVRVSAVLSVDPPERRVRVRLADPGHLVRAIYPVRLERLGPAWLGPLVDGVRARLFREPDPGFVPGEAFAADASLAFRIKESGTVLRTIAGEGWLERLLGAGLGARLPFETIGFDNQGHVGRITNPNYIHNFYLFLLFKLGILGTASVLVALALWVASLGKAALLLPPGHPDRLFLAAASGALLAYATWSLAAPEILDFRMAPLWGLMLGVSGWAVGGPGPQRFRTTGGL